MKHKMPIQIRFKDLDSLGHVNNANYFTYFELARIGYFQEVMQTKSNNWETEGIIMAKAAMDYKIPLLLGDEVYVYTWVSRLGNKSFDMDCEMVKVENGMEIAVAKGTCVLVCMNFKTNATIEIPSLWRQRIEPVIL